MKAVFKNKVHMGSDVHAFNFDVDEMPNFKAGQFTHLRIYHPSPDERGESRYFTVSASPTEDHLSITTRLVEKKSTFKQALADLKSGTTLHFEQPDGDFTLPEDKSRKLILVAGGIGVTPYRSYAKYLVDSGEKLDITLIYAVRSEKDIMFKDLFSEAGFILKPYINEGLPDIKQLIQLMGGTTGKLIYISGPEKFVELLYKELLSEGVDKKQLKTDYFPGYEASLK